MGILDMLGLKRVGTDEAAVDDMRSVPRSKWKDPEAYSGSRTFQGDITDENRLFLSLYEPPVHWIVSRVANDIYDDWFTVKNVADEDDDSLDKAVQKVLSELKAKQILTRLTVFERRYGTSLLLLGFSTQGDDTWKSPVTEGQELKLEQITPYPWPKVKVDKVDGDKSSLEYGYPIKYKISRAGASGIGLDDFIVDYTRTIRMATRLDEHLWEGNSMVDIIADDALGYRHLRGGMYKLWVRVGSGFPEISMPGASLEQLRAFEEEGYFDDLFNRNYFLSGKHKEAIEFKGAAGVALDPSPFDAIGVRAISMGTGVPADILRGTQAGTLSGSQVDERQYFKRISAEQALVEPTVKALIDVLISTGQVQFEGEYRIEWNSVFQTSDLDVARIELLEATTSEKKLKWMTRDELRDELGLGPYPEEEKIPPVEEEIPVKPEDEITEVTDEKEEISVDEAPKLDVNINLQVKDGILKVESEPIKVEKQEVEVVIKADEKQLAIERDKIGADQLQLKEDIGEMIEKALEGVKTDKARTEQILNMVTTMRDELEKASEIKEPTEKDELDMTLKRKKIEWIEAYLKANEEETEQ